MRENNKILAWDATGTAIKFVDTQHGRYGRHNKNIQSWIVRHLSIDSQYKYRKEEIRNNHFEYQNKGRKIVGSLPATFQASPVSLSEMGDIGNDTVERVLERAGPDIKSTISTRSEYFIDGLVDWLYIAAGIGLTALVPSSGVPLLLKQIALAAGLTFSKDMVKLALTDNEEQKQSIILSIPDNLLASIIVDGGVTLGLPLTKKLLAGGNIKSPLTKELNNMKDTVIGIPAYHAANHVASNINETKSDKDNTMR